MVNMNQVEKKRLEEEIVALQNQINRLQKEMKESTAERESVLDQLAAAKRQIHQERDEMQLQQTHLQNTNHKLADAENRLHLHTSLFEQVTKNFKRQYTKKCVIITNLLVSGSK